MSFTSLLSLLRYRKLKVVPMMGDGNCFYRAVATHYYSDPNMHLLLRRTLMEHMAEDPADYTPFFGSPQKFKNILHANKRAGVWNSDLADLVPVAISQLLNLRVEVFSVGDSGEIQKYSFGPERPNPIRLLLNDNHYDLLIKK